MDVRSIFNGMNAIAAARRDEEERLTEVARRRSMEDQKLASDLATNQAQADVYRQQVAASKQEMGFAAQLQPYQMAYETAKADLAKFDMLGRQTETIRNSLTEAKKNYIASHPNATTEDIKSYMAAQIEQANTMLKPLSEKIIGFYSPMEAENFGMHTPTVEEMPAISEGFKKYAPMFMAEGADSESAKAAYAAELKQYNILLTPETWARLEAEANYASLSNAAGIIKELTETRLTKERMATYPTNDDGTLPVRVKQAEMSYLENMISAAALSERDANAVRKAYKEALDVKGDYLTRIEKLSQKNWYEQFKFEQKKHADTMNLSYAELKLRAASAYSGGGGGGGYSSGRGAGRGSDGYMTDAQVKAVNKDAQSALNYAAQAATSGNVNQFGTNLTNYGRNLSMVYGISSSITDDVVDTVTKMASKSIIKKGAGDASFAWNGAQVSANRYIIMDNLNKQLGNRPDKIYIIEKADKLYMDSLRAGGYAGKFNSIETTFNNLVEMYNNKTINSGKPVSPSLLNALDLAPKTSKTTPPSVGSKNKPTQTNKPKLSPAEIKRRAYNDKIREKVKAKNKQLNDRLHKNDKGK